MIIERRHVWWAAAVVICAWGSWPKLRAWTAPDLAWAQQGCPLPERTPDDQSPLQTKPEQLPEAWVMEGVDITPLAGFSLAGRVLSTEGYRAGKEARISPLDLAIGWGPMTQSQVIDQLDIQQGGRWYTWRTRPGASIETKQIIEYSSNMHMVPANDTVARTLSKVKQGQRVRLDGWLVEAKDPDGWKWRSSLRRTDTGDGACELVYVCRVEIEGSYP